MGVGHLVDGAEVVEVEHEHRQRASRSRCAGDLAGQGLVEPASVEQAGERVGADELADGLVLARGGKRGRGLGGERSQLVDRALVRIGDLAAVGGEQADAHAFVHHGGDDPGLQRRRVAGPACRCQVMIAESHGVRSGGSTAPSSPVRPEISPTACWLGVPSTLMIRAAPACMPG